MLNLINFAKNVTRFSREIRRNIHNRRLILGIESTFDDSAAAVVDEDGNVLGESMKSQLTKHKSSGGVKPDYAMKLHEEHLPTVVEEAMTRAGVDFKDLSALATATRPGLALSLQAGLEFSKELIARHKLTFIPVHHMEAHALTVRMIENVKFPFLVLLASGGHCLLCVAQGLGRYKILGESLDEPPGAVFDKVARHLGLLTDERFSTISGGQAVEILAKQGDSTRFPFTVPLTGVRNKRSCDFSFSGLQSDVARIVLELKTSNELCDEAVRDVAAGFQRTAVQHILNHIERGVLFCRKRDLLPDFSTLVLSGGVAANSYFRQAISQLCELMDMNVICPPKHLCTDNGIMIAWAGMEYLKQGIGVAENPSEVRYEPKSPIGEYIGDQVMKEYIKLSRPYRKKEAAD